MLIREDCILVGENELPEEFREAWDKLTPIRKIKLFQIKDISTPYTFRGYDEAVSQLNLSDYKEVYSDIEHRGEIDSISDVLEGIYRTFNCDIPEDYEGRSMSVSDVVSVTTDGVTEYYYCDHIGFKLINL